jgi:hypothetical protein
MEILDKFNIDPYEYLGIESCSSSGEIKKAYKKKAKLLHPDKTQGRTEAEFKILVICYKYTIKHCVDIADISSFKELKETPREVINPRENFYDIDFENTETRNRLFVDDDINLEDFKKELEKRQGRSTTYSVENYYKKEVLDTMKTNGKFDHLKFNAFFNKLKSDGKIPNQLVKREEVKPSNANKEYVNVNVFEDMMIDSVDKRNDYKKFLQQPEITSKDITSLIDTDIKVIEKLIKSHKKDTGKISKKKLRELEEKAKAPIEIDRTKDTNKTFLEERMNVHKEALKKQKEYVLKNKRIFVNSIDYT